MTHTNAKTPHREWCDMVHHGTYEIELLDDKGDSVFKVSFPEHLPPLVQQWNVLGHDLTITYHPAVKTWDL